MKFEDMEMGYNESLGNSSRVRILSPVEETPMVVVNNNNNNDSIFKECLKNHAVSHGGHAFDGCSEFLPAGPKGSLNALKCTVCNCHRNFHRKETTLPPNFVSIGIVPATVIPVGDAYPLYNHHHHHAPPPSQYVVYPSALASILEPGNGDDGKDHGDVTDIDNGGGGGSSSNSKKRFRTNFTAEEKGKMRAFAERMD